MTSLRAIAGALTGLATMTCAATAAAQIAAGHDWSSGKPTLPVVGQPFAASGPYASYVIVATIPANPSRRSIEIENTSGAQIVFTIDDGTAASGNALANASVQALASGTAVGAQGGNWSSQVEQGRITVYAPASGAQVYIREE